MDWKKLVEILLIPIILFIIIGVITVLGNLKYDGLWAFARAEFNLIIYFPIGYLAMRRSKVGYGGVAIVGFVAGCVYGLTEHFASPVVQNYFDVIGWGIFGLILALVGGSVSTQKKLMVVMFAIAFITALLFWLGT